MGGAIEFSQIEEPIATKILRNQPQYEQRKNDFNHSSSQREDFLSIICAKP